MFNKQVLPFLISAILFMGLMSYSLWIYMNWNDPIQLENGLVEVNLPVIDWQKYSNLSKSLESSNVIENKL